MLIMEEKTAENITTLSGLTRGGFIRIMELTEKGNPVLV